MKLSRSIERQLQRIEAGIVQREEAASPQVSTQLSANIAAAQHQEDRYVEAIATLLEAMPELYQEIVTAALERIGFDTILVARHGGGSSAPAEDQIAWAICAVAGRTMRVRETAPDKTAGPLAFPETTCRWFVEHGEELRGEVAGPRDTRRMLFQFDCCDCEDCGYWVPCARGLYHAQCWEIQQGAAGGASAPGMPFLRCPVCDGATGWIAYAIKHSTPGSFGDCYRPYGEAASSPVGSSRWAPGFRGSGSTST